MAAIPLISANLATICVQSFFYGIFFVLFIVSMYLRVYRQHQLSEQSVPANNPPLLYIAPMFIAAICLFMTITAVSTAFSTLVAVLG